MPQPRDLPALLALVLAFAALACSEYQPLDTAAYLRGKYAERLGPSPDVTPVVPFELSPEIAAELDKRLHVAGSEERRTQEILDYIFHDLGLRYSLTPTRTATETYLARSGNCLSFVNLFVGVARRYRLNPMYVEVTDLQRWNQRNGLTISQGHIVAGLFVDGKLRTYDFLPYRAKAYKDFKPIDDLTAAAHYYNNLGAEALLRGDGETAERLLRTAVAIAPDFVKALNNLGVVDLRTGRVAEAIDLYEKGLAEDPKNVALLTNLARAYQQTGRSQEAAELLSRIEDVNTTNPYYYVYRGELALAQGDTDKALDFMVEALRKDTEIPEVHLGFVKIYLALGDLAKARHHLERALTLDATNEEARKYARILEEREP